MKIDKVKKMSNGKYKLILDNNEKIVTYDDVIIKNNLLYKKEINSAILNDINLDTNYYDVYNKCIKQISTKLRSELEIRKYLTKFNLDDIDNDKIVNNLKENGFINDLNYTKAYVSDRICLSNDGPNKIKKDLLNYNIDEAMIDKVIDNIEHDIIKEKLTKLVIKKIKNNHKHSNYILKQKLNNELYNLGYESSMINEIIDSNLTVNDVISKTYNTLYNKLSKKYNGEELYFQIKQKLFQKGFKSEEINNIINKKTEI